MTSTAVALDIGGSHATAARVDLTERRVLDTARRTIAEDSPAETLVRTWAGLALEIIDENVRRVSLAMPAPMDYRTGLCQYRHKFAALNGMNVADLLRHQWRGTPLERCELRIGNDADLFTTGEWWAGAARGATRVIGVTLGTGLGAGFIEHGSAIQHDPRVPPDGELWNTPYRGGLAEDFASATALKRDFQARSGEALGGAAIAERAERGDPLALAVYAALGTHLAQILEPWVRRFQPDCLVVGGNLARSWELFAPPLTGLGVRAAPSQLFETAALLGAASLETAPIL